MTANSHVDVVELTGALIREYGRGITDLRNAIAQSARVFVFLDGGDEPLSHSDAVDFITEYIGHYRYTGLPRDDQKKPLHCMSVALNHEGMQCVHHLNTLKNTFKSLHESFIHPFGYVQGSKEWRQVLKRVEEPLLNTQTVDRLFPAFTQAPRKIRWAHYDSSRSTRQTVADAVVLLEQKFLAAGDTLAEKIQQEIAHLETIPPNTPVAHRAATTREEIKYRAFFIDKEGISYTDTNYAINPLFYLDSTDNIPVRFITPYDTPSHSDTRGRPTLISNKAISSYLPGWFYYKTSTAAPTQPKRKKNNPTAKTKVPGIWIEMRASPVFAYRNVEGMTRTANIHRLGLSRAWEKAITEVKGFNAEERSALEKLVPTQDDIDERAN